MSCDCCVNEFDLGCYNACEEFDTGIVLPEDDYKVGVEFNGAWSYFEVTVDGEETLKLQRAWFNESYDHTLQIRDSQGLLYEYQPSNVAYDCLLVKVRPAV